jgi:hypothetical protein
MTHANVDEIRDAHKKPTVNDIYEKIALSNNGKLLRHCLTREELLLADEMIKEGFLKTAAFYTYGDSVRIAG